MQCDGSRKIKYKWERVSDASPSKYLKCSERCRQPSPRLGVREAGRATSNWPGTSADGNFAREARCPEGSFESGSSLSESLTYEIKHEDSVSGDSSLFPMSRTSREASSQKNSSNERKKRSSDQVSSALFRRTLFDIFGSSLKQGREAASSGRDPKKSSPETTEARRPRREHARNVSSSNERQTRESKRERDGKDCTQNEGGKCCASSVDGTQPTDTWVQPVYNGGLSTSETSRLVFLYEDDSDEDDRKKVVIEREPSIGSDFSDVEDMEPLTKFSQEEVSPSFFSRENVTSPPSECIGYPPRCDYSKSWTSTPRSGSKAQKQAELSSSSSSKNVGLAEVSSFNRSNDFDTTDEDGCCQSASFNSFRIYKEKRTFKEVELDISYNTQTSDFIPEDFVKERLPVELPKWLQEGFIDTHCHLDMLYSKLSFKGSFAKFRREYNSTFPKEFQGCITDFCNPRFLKNFPWKELLEEDMVWGAFGCHPHFAQYYTERQEQELLYALRHPKAIAFGEMGLDYSHKCTSEVSTQHKVFERQLELGVALKKPLVIHCRDADTDLLEIMKKFVPRDYKIHRHCFTGSYDVIEPFLLEFPNLAVGFTALLTYPSACEAREALRKIPLERIIVETDAPYFLPRQVPKNTCRFSHPGLALHTVGEIARLKELPISSVLGVLRQNTKRLYNL
uniref:Deoxyribonuclease TATDN2 n=1 Tax=Geotrypetes seraphini TaxID=260995 RepID=A0A6P8PJN0_GEOSA|nr:putative deoxyribonuclease TATDN2 [Geotrypetes seraphini]XP_033781720.1 putative deoxyribonuclease TATDN2 [Geotrypetes seraphini]